MKGWRNTIVGTGLVIFGLLLLIDQLTNARLFGRLFLLVLGAGFIAAALANRAPGLTVPGGILSGVGLGSLAMNAFRRGSPPGTWRCVSHLPRPGLAHHSAHIAGRR